MIEHIAASHRGDRRLPLLLDVPSRLPGRARHASRDLHAARLGADDRRVKRGQLHVERRDRRRAVRRAPTAACAGRTASPISRCRTRSPSARRRRRGGHAPKAVYALHEKLQKWGNRIRRAASAKRRPAGDVGVFIGDAAAVSRAAGRGKRRSVAGGGRARARAGRCRALERRARQLARVSRHRHGTREGRAGGRRGARAAARCSCSRLAIATPSNGSTANGSDIAWPAGVAVKEVTAVAGGRARRPDG